MAKHECKETYERLLLKISELTRAMEKANIAEYVEFYNRPHRLISVNFLNGVARGFGFAVGFTLVGAIFLYILGHIATLNIPLFSGFIAEITRIVQEEMAARP